MKAGKVSENVLKRSIFKKIDSRRSEVLTENGVGVDCAYFSLNEGEKCALATDTCTAAAVNPGMFAVHGAVNNLAAAGAEPVAVQVSILLPVETEESELQGIMSDIEATAKALNIEVCGGHTEVTEAVAKPVISVTALGKAHCDVDISKTARPGNDIVVTKWIGLEGTTILAREYEEELKTRFPAKMIFDAIQYDRLLSVVHEAAPAVKSGVTAMHDAGQGGIFGALWEMAEASHVGLEIDIKKIPVKQETIEICNFFDINPYGLLSGGALIMATDDGNRLVADLAKEGISAAVIGKCTDSNDRIIINGENVRFLEPSKTDEIFKLKEIKK